MIHQTADPIRVVATADPRAYERFWFCAGTTDGDIALAVGCTFYPNLDVAESYAIVNRRGRHTAVRAGRALGSDRLDMTVGPISANIEAGLRRWRLRLGENDGGLMFDLTWYDEKRHSLRVPSARGYDGQPWGHQPAVTGGFEGFGSFEGTLNVHGIEYQLSRGTCHGTRDRHWGHRPNIGGRQLLAGTRAFPGVQGGQYVDFGDWALWQDKILYPPAAGPATEGVRAVSHRIRFEEDTKIFAEAVVKNRLASGEVRELRFTRCGPNQTLYLRAGGYGGPNGGTPGGDHWEGERQGAELPFVEGETLDVTLPEVKLSVSGLNEHLCTVRWQEQTAVGFYQTYDPLTYERCAGAKPGWSLL